MSDRPYDDSKEQAEVELIGLLDDIKRRIGESEPVLQQPPVGLWDRIESQLDDGTSSDSVAPLRREDSNVTSLDHHRRKRRPAGMLLGAIAASVLAAVVIGSALRDSSSVVAEVALGSLEDQPALGSATVVDDGDGNLRLDVDFEATIDPGTDGDFEIWIIDTDIEEMYSLGSVGRVGNELRSFDLPAGVSIDDFPIVDISWEPKDGVATHSGMSKYRGIVGDA